VAEEAGVEVRATVPWIWGLEALPRGKVGQVDRRRRTSGPRERVIVRQRQADGKAGHKRGNSRDSPTRSECVFPARSRMEEAIKRYLRFVARDEIVLHVERAE